MVELNTAIIIGVVTTIVVFLLINFFPAIIGFTAAGIASGSPAASMMSCLGGGDTESGSLVATCQSCGASKMSAVCCAVIFVFSAFVGVYAGYFFYNL